MGARVRSSGGGWHFTHKRHVKAAGVLDSHGDMANAMTFARTSNGRWAVHRLPSQNRSALTAWSAINNEATRFLKGRNCRHRWLILDGCGKPQQLIPLLVSEDQFVPGEEGWVRTLCQQCSAGCGITVRVMQGESIRTINGQQKRVKAVQAKKIEGNPDHPISMGGTCARGQAGVQALYHPDRIQNP